MAILLIYKHNEKDVCNGIVDLLKDMSKESEAKVITLNKHTHNYGVFGNRVDRANYDILAKVNIDEDEKATDIDYGIGDIS